MSEQTQSVLNLEKGGQLMLEKANNSGSKLEQIIVGLGWDMKPGSATGADFDLDASLVCIGSNGKALPGGFLWYNTPKTDGKLQIFNGSIIHTGDNLTGEGEGDDERIIINLNEVPAEVEKMIVVVDIFKASERGQNFGMAENSFIRLLNGKDNETEMIHFDLNFDASTATGAKFATIYRRNGEWAFSADQTEFTGGLNAIAAEYGING